LTTNFILREPNAKSATPINIRLAWKNNSMLFGTGVKINPSYFLENNAKNKDNRISSRHPQDDEYNALLNGKRREIEKSFNKYVAQVGFEPQNASDFRKFFERERNRQAEEERAAINKKVDLFQYFGIISERNDKRLLAIGKPINKNSISSSYKQTAKVLKEFEMDYAPYKLTFDTIDLDFYDDFLDYCNEVRVYSVNNIGKHIKNLKTIMREALEEGLTSNTKFLSKRFKVINEEVFNVYLPDDELDLLYNAPLSGRQEIVRDLFIVGCYTALRISDFSRIKKHHITEDNNIKIQTTKTGTVVEIPMNQQLYDTLKKYDFEMPSLANQTFNETIKEVCKEVGINSIQTFEKSKGGKKITVRKPKFEMVTSHTCRRTFATKYYNEDLSTITIMAMTGHKSEKSFLRYIKATAKDHAKLLRAHYIKQGNNLSIVR
jgi:integrase